MESLNNLDLLSVGISVAAICILGFAVLFSNQKSITNRSFFLFAFAATFWNIFNYLVFKLTNPDLILGILRTHVFFAVWYCFSLFQLFYVFPEEKFRFGKKYIFILVPLVFLVSVIAISPLTFVKITEFTNNGYVKSIMNGPGIFIFGITVVSLILSAFMVLLRKLTKAAPQEKKQLRVVLAGFWISFSLHVVFNFIFPAILDNSTYAPLGALFTFPLIAFTAYAIFRYKLLNIKIITTEILAFVISTVALIQVIMASGFVAVVFNVGIFLLILSFSILLIKSVRREVEQREKLEILSKELAEANDKLKELDHLKSEFLSFASHQIKAPLAVIKGFATLIYDGTYGEVPEKVSGSARKIKESADRMTQLVTDFLNVRKIEEGKMDYKLEKLNAVEIIKNIFEELRSLAQNKKLDFNLELPAEEGWISADAQNIRQVFQNIIENAIKYTDTGFVKVKVELKSESLVFSVSDSGHGMSKELLPHLFEEFKRGGKEKLIEGTGLGLYIAKAIVETHRGKIWAESEGTGKGSVFLVKLPLA